MRDPDGGEARTVSSSDCREEDEEEVAVLWDDFSPNVVVLSNAFRDSTSAGSCGADGIGPIGRRGACSTTNLNWNMPSLEKQPRNH